MIRMLLVLVVGCSIPQRAEVVPLPPSPPPGPWMALREALYTCADRHGLVGDLGVRISIDGDGGPGSVSSPHDGFSSCVGRTISRWRYHAYANRVLYIPFVLQAPVDRAQAHAR